MNKNILSFINEFEGFKTAIKNLHWSADNLSQHELCDDIASSISDFEDLVSEVEQSMSGKIKLNGFTPKTYKITSLKSFVEDVISVSKDFLNELEGMGENYVGIKSECETFIGDMQRKLYLVNFTLKEEFKEEFKRKLQESMPKNLANHDEIDKFMGRRPKSIKARINQIYKIVKKYGIDSRLYTDDHWQAVEDYYRAISSLGCDVEMKPCANVANADSMMSDGGYGDYDSSDNMARSKQYVVKITFEDGMSINGYIKCMAAGTVEDPFSRYDTCIVLWPKSNRVLETKNQNGVIKLTESELKQVVKDAAIKVIRETAKESKETITEMGDTCSGQDALGRVAGRAISRIANNIGSKNYKENEKYAKTWRDAHHTAKDAREKHSSSEDEKKMKSDAFDRGTRKEVGKYKVTESELMDVIKEATMMLVNEYSQKMANTNRFIRSTHGHGDINKRHKEPSEEERAETRRRLGIKEPEKVEEEGKIEIKPENRGKFNATKKALGKSTEELTHSKNPITKKRAIFAQNAKRWNKK